MPPALETNTPAHIANRRLVYLILVLGLCIIMAATFFWFHSREEQTSATQPTPVTLVPFSSNLVLSLTAPVKDTEGIPYSGLVHFDPDTNRYSYLASSDDGTVLPAGTTAFASNGYFLAQQLTGSSSDLVLYNKETLKPERTVAAVEPQHVIGTTIWSQNSDKFAYYVVEDEGARVVVESFYGKQEQPLPPQYPLGFSPDATLLLTRSLPSLSIIRLSDASTVTTTGSAFLDPATRFVVARGGEWLVAYTDTQLEWYTVNWATSEITLVGSIKNTKPLRDVLVTPDDNLLVREEGSTLLRTYSYTEEGGVTLVSASEATFPPDAFILNVVSW